MSSVREHETLIILPFLHTTVHKRNKIPDIFEHGKTLPECWHKEK